MLNVYQVHRISKSYEYDEFISAIVVAESETAAIDMIMSQDPFALGGWTPIRNDLKATKIDTTVPAILMTLEKG